MQRSCMNTWQKPEVAIRLRRRQGVIRESHVGTEIVCRTKQCNRFLAKIKEAKRQKIKKARLHPLRCDERWITQRDPKKDFSDVKRSIFWWYFDILLQKNSSPPPATYKPINQTLTLTATYKYCTIFWSKFTYKTMRPVCVRSAQRVDILHSVKTADKSL